MMEYNSVANPVWVDSSHKMITVDVVFPSLGNTPVKFNACASDVESYGCEMFAALIAGAYGHIAEPATAG